MTVAEGVTLIGAVAAAVVSIMTAAIALYTAQKSASTHQLVNGISGKLATAHTAQGHAEGQLEQLVADRVPSGSLEGSTAGSSEEIGPSLTPPP